MALTLADWFQTFRTVCLALRSAYTARWLGSDACAALCRDLSQIKATAYTDSLMLLPSRIRSENRA